MLEQWDKWAGIMHNLHPWPEANFCIERRCVGWLKWVGIPERSGCSNLTEKEHPTLTCWRSARRLTLTRLDVAALQHTVTRLAKRKCGMLEGEKGKGHTLHAKCLWRHILKRVAGKGTQRLQGFSLRASKWVTLTEQKMTAITGDLRARAQKQTAEVKEQRLHGFPAGWNDYRNK